MMTPKLRFKEFSDDWHKYHLKNIADRITRKNKNNESKLPLTISSLDGLVDQITYFNKKVASKDMSGYYLLLNGEFAYNKSYSAGFPFGSVKRLDRYDNGALSTLYICFKPKSNINSDFFLKYFETSKWHKEVSMTVAEGARNHGLLNVNVEDFFNTLHTLPTSFQEQHKVADFLYVIDEKIENQLNIIESLEKQKKGFMQNIFSRELCFKDEKGNTFPEWEEKCLGAVSDVRDGTHESPKYVSEGFALLTSKNLNQNGTLNFDDISFITKEDFESINKRSKVDVGDILFGMIGTIGNPVQVKECNFAIKNVALIKENKILLNSFLIDYLRSNFVAKQFYKNQAGGTQKFIALGMIRELIIPIPTLPEQQKIADFLSSFDEKIETEKQILTHWQTVKKGLLQQMFV